MSRRTVRDALAIVGVCLATYLAAANLQPFGPIRELVKRHSSYELDAAIVVAILFGFLMVIYALRRVQDLREEIVKRRTAELKLTNHGLRLTTAVNNMSQGLLMFDGDGRLIVCNERYIRMYGLSTDIVKPGCTLLELLEHRRQCGTFDADPKDYELKIMAAARSGQRLSVTNKLANGHLVEVLNQPMVAGGWVATHEDVTERTLAEARIAKEADVNRRLFDTSLDLILVTDGRGHFVRVNPISMTILGYPPEEMVGRSAVDFIYPDDLDPTRSEMRLTRRGQNMRNFETRYVHKQGHVVALAWSGVWSEPEQKYFFTGRDVTESKLAEEKLRYLAHYDQLTQLPNRTSLHDDLAELVKTRVGTGRSAASIAIFDLDGFKDINDTLGHSAGDTLLQEVARRISAVAVGNARFYRLGGDEFVLTVSDSSNPRKIGELVETILKRLAETRDQNTFLHSAKCEEAQGFLYAKPLPVPQFEEFLKLNQLQLQRLEKMPSALVG